MRCESEAGSEMRYYVHLNEEVRSGNTHLSRYALGMSPFPNVLRRHQNQELVSGSHQEKAMGLGTRLTD